MSFPWQVDQSMVTAYTDSDWAGCSKTARSTSGGIIMIGCHVIKTYSRQQKVVALSSAEAELYAMVAASAEALAIVAYAQDLGLRLSGEVYTDSSAALGISQRAGIGKVRHLRTQGLWVQETRMSGRFAYKKVLGKKNPSDILTKHVCAELMDKHLETVGVEAREGRAEAAPELSSVVEWFQVCPVKKVTFSAEVTVRAIPSRNTGRKCQGRHEGRHGPRGGAGRKSREEGTTLSGTTPSRTQWADWTDEEEEEKDEEKKRKECGPGLPECLGADQGCQSALGRTRAARVP